MNKIECIDKQNVKGCCNAPLKTIIRSGIAITFGGETIFYKKPYSVEIIRQSFIIDDGENKKTYNINKFPGLTKKSIEVKFQSCLRGYNVYTGSESTSSLDNGQMEEIDVTVAGVKVNTANSIAISNADQLPSGLFITSKEVVAADTVRVVVENQTGNTINAITLEISVLEF